MTLQNLYSIADEKKIEVDYYPMRKTVSMSMPSDKDCYIAIDVDRIKTLAEEKTCLAHELGHCETGSFYNFYSKLDIRQKHENRADKWAIKKLIPKNELKEALNCGICGTWELAEYFEVTEDFMLKALIYYTFLGEGLL